MHTCNKGAHLLIIFVRDCPLHRMLVAMGKVWSAGARCESKKPLPLTPLWWLGKIGSTFRKESQIIDISHRYFT
jgi:hypothetical protein